MNNERQFDPARYTQQDLTNLYFALPSDEWTIQIVPEGNNGQPIRDIIPARKLFSMTNVSWFRARNADECHIYGRPNSTRYLLVDLDKNADDAIRQMRADEFPFSALIKTSPGKFQAWIAVSKEELPIPVATELGKLIAQRYRGDSGSTDAFHVGRLPGLRNKKQKYRAGPSDGGPLVRLQTARMKPKIPYGMEKLIEEAERLASARTAPPPSAPAACAPVTRTNLDIDPTRSPMTPEEAHEIYDAELQLQAERKGWELPIQKGLRSDADYAVVYGLLVRYGFDPDDLAALLHFESEKAAEQGIKYVERTVKAAYR